MTDKIRIAMLLAAMMMFSWPAAAVVTTGNKLQALCKSLINEKNQDFIEAGRCAGFIDGFVGGYLISNALSETTTEICIPDEATLGQMARVFLKYADDHPNELHLPAESILLRAYRTAFPCRKN